MPILDYIYISIEYTQPNRYMCVAQVMSESMTSHLSQPTPTWQEDLVATKMTIGTYSILLFKI